MAPTAPDLPPKPGRYAIVTREGEYKPHGTVSLRAGIDLVSGQVHALVKDHHRFARVHRVPEGPRGRLGAWQRHHADPRQSFRPHLQGRPRRASTGSRTAASPYTFTPKHGSWLKLIEGYFSKLARSGSRHIRVASKQELKARIMAAIKDINQNPVLQTRSYELDQAA